jgi:Flp pilus assembly pilin Flp
MNGRFIAGNLLARRRRNRRRSGQTLVEYGLILAYVSVAVIQVMTNLSIYSTETYIDTNCDLIIAQSSSEAQAQASIITYLETFNYGNYSTADKTIIFNSCYTTMMNNLNTAFGSSSSS